MTPRPNHQPPVNASRLLEHWQPSKEMNRASNHGHNTESRQLPRECYRGTRPTLATSNGLFPSLRAYDHRGHNWPTSTPREPVREWTEGMTPRPNHQPPVNASRLLEHWHLPTLSASFRRIIPTFSFFPKAGMLLTTLTTFTTLLKIKHLAHNRTTTKPKRAHNIHNIPAN